MADQPVLDITSAHPLLAATCNLSVRDVAELAVLRGLCANAGVEANAHEYAGMAAGIAAAWLANRAKRKGKPHD